MAYRRNTRKYGGNSTFSSSGQVYKTGSSTYEVRRHSLERVVEIEPQKSKIIPLLAYYPSEGLGTTITATSKVTASGSKIYPTVAIQEGSRVNAIHLDVTIEPKTGSSSQITPFYVGRVATSFHDVKGGNIYGLEPDGDTGKVKFSDEASTPSLSDVITSGGATTSNGPELSMTKESFDLGDIIKHWWRGVRKNVMFGGQPVVYNRWEKVPNKCKRSNPGMFYGMLIMNDASAVSGDTDTLKVTIKQNFNEIPLIQ